MPECRPPVAAFSAGATINASSSGPSSGTAIWRGFPAVSAARRRASGSSALLGRTRRGTERGIEGACAMVDIRVLLSVRVGGVLEVDVVERRRTRRNPLDFDARLVDRFERVG